MFAVLYRLILKFEFIFSSPGNLEARGPAYANCTRPIFCFFSLNTPPPPPPKKKKKKKKKSLLSQGKILAKMSCNGRFQTQHHLIIPVR